MNKKGFTLVELMTVILLIGVITTITTVVVIGALNDAKETAFKDSVYAAMNSYINMESYDDFNDQGEVNVTNLSLDNNNFTSGTVKRNENNEVVVTDITDGNFCANGTRKELVVEKGKCE